MRHAPVLVKVVFRGQVQLVGLHRLQVGVGFIRAQGIDNVILQRLVGVLGRVAVQLYAIADPGGKVHLRLQTPELRTPDRLGGGKAESEFLRRLHTQVQARQNMFVFVLGGEVETIARQQQDGLLGTRIGIADGHRGLVDIEVTVSHVFRAYIAHTHITVDRHRQIVKCEIGLGIHGLRGLFLGIYPGRVCQVQLIPVWRAAAAAVGHDTIGGSAKVLQQRRIDQEGRRGHVHIPALEVAVGEGNQVVAVGGRVWVEPCSPGLVTRGPVVGFTVGRRFLAEPGTGLH